MTVAPKDRHVVLSGLMGSGKSTLARALAERMGRACVDMDDMIASRTGLTIERWFSERGEDAFRDVEAHMVSDVIEETAPKVIALGGGAALRTETRKKLLKETLLITLTAPVDELSRRVAMDTSRPLLKGGNAVEVLSQLKTSRAASYAECHASIETKGQGTDVLVTQIERFASLRCVAVPLGVRSYSVWIGTGLKDVVEHMVEQGRGEHTVVMVSDMNVEPIAGKPLLACLKASGHRVIDVVLPPGEAHKTLQNVEQIWNAALEGGVSRSDIVVGVGGGVVGDLAGFAASSLLRGIELGHVPTTLLSMVDSSVGGKTGFDRPQGKNLIGTFYQPRFVCCDLEHLRSLPMDEYRSGLAEVIKAAWIEGDSAVQFLEQNVDALLANHVDVLSEAIERAVALKARVVKEDEQESGLRRVLNLGHTIGHAIEAYERFEGIRHGEAVSLGMVASARVGVRLGMMQKEEALRLERLLRSLGLPTDVAPWLKRAEMFQFLSSDKKRSGETLHYVVPGAPGKVDVVPLSVEKLQQLLS